MNRVAEAVSTLEAIMSVAVGDDRRLPAGNGDGWNAPPLLLVATAWYGAKTDHGPSTHTKPTARHLPFIDKYLELLLTVHSYI